jgi:hypothetical protein
MSWIAASLSLDVVLFLLDVVWALCCCSFPEVSVVVSASQVTSHCNWSLFEFLQLQFVSNICIVLQRLCNLVSNFSEKEAMVSGSTKEYTKLCKMHDLKPGISHLTSFRREHR